MTPLASGRTATIYRLPDDGRALKLYERGIGRETPERERAAMAAAHAQGLPALAPGALIQHDGRWGLTMALVSGPSGMERLLAGADVPTEADTLAILQAQVHRASGAGLRAVKTRLREAIARAGFDADQVRALGRVRESLPDGEVLLHGDFHPGNLLFAANAIVIVDWPDASHGDPVADVARSLVLFGWQLTDDPLRRAYAQRFLQTYRDTTGSALDRLDDWLLVCRAARLAEGIADDADVLRKRVHRSLEGR
jgi:Ser/Thr protein kinase RdoA (MazF antagonist)